MIENYRYHVKSDKIIIIIGDNLNELKCKSIIIKREENIEFYQLFARRLKECVDDSVAYYYINEVRKKILYDFNSVRCNLM